MILLHQFLSSSHHHHHRHFAKLILPMSPSVHGAGGIQTWFSNIKVQSCWSPKGEQLSCGFWPWLRGNLLHSYVFIMENSFLQWSLTNKLVFIISILLLHFPWKVFIKCSASPSPNHLFFGKLAINRICVTLSLFTELLVLKEMSSDQPFTADVGKSRQWLEEFAFTNYGLMNSWEVKWTSWGWVRLGCVCMLCQISFYSSRKEVALVEHG